MQAREPSKRVVYGAPHHLVETFVEHDHKRYYLNMLLYRTVATLSLIAPIAAQAVFGPATNVNVGTFNGRAVEVTDFDGDGDLDILTLHSASVEWAENDGAGNFSTHMLVNTSNANFADGQDLVAADVDGDGDEDILIASGSDRKLAWYINSGNGQAGPQQIIATPAGKPKVLHVADVDGDGDLDAVYYTTNFQIVVSENMGFGFWGGSTAIWTPPDPIDKIESLDFDADGDLDLIAQSNAALYALEHTGGGLNYTSQALATSANGAAGPTPGGHGQGISDICVIDMNNDGLNDVVYMDNSSTTNSAWLNGCLIMTRTDTREIALLPALSTGGFGARVQMHIQSFVDVNANLSCPSLSNPATQSPSKLRMACGDINNDGANDIAYSYIDLVAMTRGVAYMLQTQANILGPGSANLHSANSPSPHVYVGLHDLNGNGNVDALWGDPISLSYNPNFSSPPTTASATTYGTGCGSTPMSMAATSNPIIGNQISANVTQTPTPFCWLGMGVSNSTLPGTGPLPLDLSSIGMTNCNLYMSAEVFGLPTTSAGVAFQMNFAAPIPNTQSLVGQHFYFQALSLAPGANPAGIIMSNGVDYLIGNQ